VAGGETQIGTADRRLHLYLGVCLGIPVGSLASTLHSCLGVWWNLEASCPWGSAGRAVACWGSAFTRGVGCKELNSYNSCSDLYRVQHLQGMPHSPVLATLLPSH
jgi:hypothetical protein